MSSESVDDLNLKEREISEEEVFYSGALCATDEQLAAISCAPRLLRAMTLPASVDLSNNFPPVGNQGSQNSCVGWAIAYALKTYQEQVERNWGVNTSSHQFSPSFIYNLRPENVNGTDKTDNGMYIIDGLVTVIEKGICTLESMPYKITDFNTKPNEKQEAEALKYRATGYDWIYNNDIDTIKEYLYKGIPIIMRFPSYSDLANLSSSNPILDNTRGEKPNGGHAVCLVGYNDNYVHGGKTVGVFRFINSWGTNKGINGYGYVAYDFIKNNPGGIEAYVLYDKIDVKSISLNSSTIELPIGESQTITPTILPLNATNKGIEYTSKNSSIATVSSTGTVYAVSLGQTSITAMSKDTDSNIAATCSVNVKDAAISLSMSSMDLYVGESQVLTKTITPSNNITNSVMWSSSNPAVATINSSTGTVSALLPGETTITVRCNYANSNAVASCRVKVNHAKISLDKTYMELYLGESQVLTKTVTPSNSLTSSVTWSSSNPGVATINGVTGVVNAISSGETTITVKCNYTNSNASASCRVKVKDINDSIFISDTIPDKMAAGKTYHVTITLRNIGITNWTANQEDGIGNYYIGNDILLFNGSNRITLPLGTVVSPGEIYIFNLQMKAPEEAGAYKSGFRMLNADSAWFGDILEKKIVVFDPNAEFNTYDLVGRFTHDQLSNHSHYTIRHEKFWTLFNTYGSIGTFKYEQLSNHSHYVIRNEKLKNQHRDLHGSSYLEMQAHTQNQLREGELYYGN